MSTAAERRKKYRAYLKSEHWASFRRRYFAQHPRKCSNCGTTERINLHHLTYERLGGERMEDVTPLCRPCHGAVHGVKLRRKRRPKGRSKVVVIYADGTITTKGQGDFTRKRKRVKPMAKAPRDRLLV